MSYPKCVYHKDYDSNFGPSGHEEYLNKYSKVVRNEEELKKLGLDWGDHPNEKPSKKASEDSESKKVVSEEKVSEILEDVVAIPKRGRKAKE